MSSELERQVQLGTLCNPDAMSCHDLFLGDNKRLKSLRNHLVKMSKSDLDRKSRIDVTDSPDDIRAKFKKALTDFPSEITYDPQERPALANLIDIHAALTDSTPQELQAEYSSLNKVQYKERLAELTIEYFAPVRKETQRLLDDRAHLESVLTTGADRARAIASDNMTHIRKLIGFSYDDTKQDMSAKTTV